MVAVMGVATPGAVMMTIQRTTYGQTGSEGPTKGEKAVAFTVTLPDGSKRRKVSYRAPVDAVAFAYQHEGSWYIAGINERGAPDMQSSRFTVCPVSIVGGALGAA